MENNFMIDNFVIGIQRCRKLQFFFLFSCPLINLQILFIYKKGMLYVS